ncbi:jg15990 [Pararge aegeria aegeria]|uniref:Jg15990 protein n=1 Tax=Pararge aegeria aegeria TaxID=348720 RepID=A0A8S4SR78_9NEOP|nr:jg15990 [Pararge aegeria aegeria]
MVYFHANDIWICLYALSVNRRPNVGVGLGKPAMVCLRRTAQRVTKLKGNGRAHSSEKGWTLGSQGAGMAARTGKRIVARPPTRLAAKITGSRLAVSCWSKAPVDVYRLMTVMA